MNNKKLVAILIRGLVGVSHDVVKTLKLLRLMKKHAAVVVDDTPQNRGMLNKVKNYVTYGTIDEEMYAQMLEKRGEVVGGVKFSKTKLDAKKIAKEFFDGKLHLRNFEIKYQLKPFFRLAPPVGGFERKGIKKPYTVGGVLGPRGDKIKDLIERML